MLLYASSFLCSVPLFVPFVFLPAFARDLGVSAVSSAALIGVIGIGSVCGRLGLGTLADRLGLIGLYLLCFLLQALSYAIWLGAHSYLTLVIFALVIGTGYGGYSALAPTVLALFFGTRNLGALVGTLYTSNAFGTLIGPPLAGFIIDRREATDGRSPPRSRWRPPRSSFCCRYRNASFPTLAPQKIG